MKKDKDDLSAGEESDDENGQPKRVRKMVECIMGN